MVDVETVFEQNLSSSIPAQVEALEIYISLKVPGWYNLDHFHPQCPKRFLNHIPGAEVTFDESIQLVVTHVMSITFWMGKSHQSFFKTTITYL